MINIAIDGSILDERPEGVGVYTLQVVDHLIDFQINSNFSLNMFTGIVRDPWLTKKGIRIYKTPDLTQHKYGPKAALFRIIWGNILFPKQSKHLAKSDLIYFPSHYGSIFTQIPQIITIHDVAPLFFKQRYILQHYYFKYFLPHILHKSDKVIAVSDNTRFDVIKYYNVPVEKVVTVKSGYDSNNFCLKNVSKNVAKKYTKVPYILLVGASLSHKNIKRVLMAFASIRRQIKHIILIAGGKGGYLQELKALVKQMDLGDRVHFLGYVPYLDLPSLYGNADVLVFASLYEGFGFPPLEAMACGCPVITSKISSLPEICGDAALYIDPFNQDSIRDGILRLCSDPDMRNELRSKGFNQVRKFSWKKTANGIIKVFNMVCPRLEWQH